MTKKKKYILVSISVLLLLTIFIGITYAYWKISYTQTTSNKIATSCFSMELSNEKNDITLESAYPISDEKGKSLTPYSFTITNTCDLFASYTINLEMLEGTTLNSKYIKTMINNEAITNLNTLETTDTSIDGAIESRVLFKGSLGSGDSTDYTFRLWMDSETPAIDDAMNKVFQAKITIIAEVSNYSPVANGFTNLADALLVNEYQTTNVDVAKNKINSKQSVDFSKTAPLIEWGEQKAEGIHKPNAIRGSVSQIGTYGISENATKFRLGTEYVLNKETGYYIITNAKYYSLEELDFENKKYYYCTNSLTASGDNTVQYLDRGDCTNLYELIGINEIVDATIELSSKELLPVKNYVFDAYKYITYEKESDKSDKGLYEAIDDYGISYYYRGNITNNYVKFANFYWRVIRINGDGSVRLLYAGTSSNPAVGTLGIAKVAYSSIMDNPTYVGYMYSNTINISYKDTIKNDNDSTIKTTLDNWYKTNVLDKGYSTYLADSGFCNDRSLSTSSSGNGYTINGITGYASAERLSQNKPILTCPNINDDLFTLSDNTIGNKSLIYPIGLITIDELIYSGYSVGKINTNVYTFADRTYWTMTPYHFNGNILDARIWISSQTGGTGYSIARNEYRARPVINLKSTTEISGGIGTKNDPFIIK